MILFKVIDFLKAIYLENKSFRTPPPLQWMISIMAPLKLTPPLTGGDEGEGDIITHNPASPIEGEGNKSHFQCL